MSKQKVDIIDYLNIPIPMLEAFRILSANLGLNKKILKVISVLSFKPGEGKTTVAINLAIVAAKSGNRVLYVDADLRKPRHLKRQGSESTKGLTDFCEGTEIEDVVCQTGIENLNYVTAGNKLVDPVEFLCSQSFDGFIDAAFRHYNMILIDSSSLGKYVDSAIIAAKVSGVLVVTRSRKTGYKNIDRIKWQMKNIGANIIGIVVNRVERRDFKSYFILPNHPKYLLKNLKHFKLFKRLKLNS